MFKFLFLEVIFFINFIYLLPILKSANAHVNSPFVEHLVCYLFIVSAPFFFFFLTDFVQHLLNFFTSNRDKQTEMVCFVFYSYFIWSYIFVGLIGQPPTEMICFVFYFYFIWSYLFVGLIGQPPNLLIDMNEHKHRIQVRDKKKKKKSAMTKLIEKEKKEGKEEARE